MSKVTGLSKADLKSVTVTLVNGESYTREAADVNKDEGVLAAFCNSQDKGVGVNTDLALYAGLTNYQLASICNALMSELHSRAEELYRHVMGGLPKVGGMPDINKIISGRDSGNDPLGDLLRMLQENGLADGDDDDDGEHEDDEDEDDDTFVRPDVDGLADIDEVL